jgi:TolB-like protein/Tfp pilus assembly protein PilF
MQRKPGLLSELKRRRVVRTAAVYAAAGFLVVQVADLLLPALLLPEWTFRMVVALLILGFPLAVGLAWSFDITAEGLRRTDAGAGRASAPVREDAIPVGPPGEQPRGPKVEPPGPSAGGGWGRVAWVSVGAASILALGLAAVRFGSEPAQSPAAHVPLTAAAVPAHSIAVLPLRNLAGGEENERFADGMTEDILTNLGLVPDFAVTSRSSAMRYKGSTKTIQEVAAELGVRYVLEGSLRRDGDRVRVVIQLVEPGSDRQMWAQTLDRREEDVFALQSEVAQAVVDALRVELTGGLEQRMGRAPTDDFRAYELFLEGRDAYYRYTPEDMARATDLFEQALERDPEFALAHAWLGSAYAVAVFNYRAEARLLSAAEASARRAIALQPDLGDGYRALGTMLGISGRFAEARPALERAIELNPHDFAAIGNLGLMYSLSGEWDRAIEIVLISIRRDPTRSYIDYSNLAGYASRLGLFDRAAEAVEQALTLSAGHSTPLWALAQTELYRGRAAEARAAVERMIRPGTPPSDLDIAGYVLAAIGDEGRARSFLERAHEAAPDARPQLTQPPSVVLAHLLHRAGETARAEAILVESERLFREAIAEGDASPGLLVALAGIATVRGRTDEALDRLDQAVDSGWSDAIGTRLDPVLAPLRGNPRFETALGAMEARIESMRARVVDRF